MKTALRILGCILLLGLAAGGWLGYEIHAFLSTPAQNPGSETYFDVTPGMRFGQASEALARAGLVTDARKFGWLARYKKWDNRLQAGRFALHSGWPPEKILDALVNGQPVLYRVTVPEGLTWWQTARLLEDAGLVTQEDFRRIVFDPDFLRHHGIPFASAEGFLMPDTYLLKKNDSPDLAQARSVAGRMIDNFWRKSAALWPEQAKPAAEQLKTWAILASVVEKETGHALDREMVASVFTNRLRKGMPLQSDPTTIYGLGERFDGNLRKKDLRDPSPYNTYVHRGLPPSPISLPGLHALQATARPAQSDKLYFVARGDGRSEFSADLASHNRAVDRFQRRAGGKPLKGTAAADENLTDPRKAASGARNHESGQSPGARP